MHPLLDPAQRPVFAHRGNAAHAPENTLESFRAGLSLGADGIELDVRVTADGRVVVIHDPTVDRTTDGSGPVEQMSLAEMQDLDAGARRMDRGVSWAGRGVRIPTLERVLEDLPGTPLLIEIKSPPAARLTRALIERHGAQARCVIAAFDDAVRYAFHGSGIARASSRRETFRRLAPALLGLRARSLPYQAMCIPDVWRHVPVPVGLLARSCARAGVLVHVWTIDQPETARALWNRGVHGIISNDPAVILRERDR